MKKQFILTLDWGDSLRFKQVQSMLNQGYTIKHHFEPQIIGESHVYVFVKEDTK
jgi:ribulose bisphosphate carboxylase small subunit